MQQIYFLKRRQIGIYKYANFVLTFGKGDTMAMRISVLLFSILFLLNCTKKVFLNNAQDWVYSNNYYNPTKIWGMEEIDFEKSQTKKFVSDKFKMFEIPRAVFGEKIIENTVVL